jgi:diguanylate cyclase (GGDEF)-like protein
MKKTIDWRKGNGRGDEATAAGHQPGPKESRFYRGFVISLAATLGLALAAIFVGIALQARALIREELLTRARAHFSSIVSARKWNAQYGGVYVEKGPGVESSPFLPNPDLQTTDGRILTLKSHAAMTREISDFPDNEGHLKFHITSLKPLNPANAPDAWEAKALRLFETGVREAFEDFREAKRSIYRYMAPLTVEKSCLACHAAQGYKMGDIRGGVSVRFEFGSVQERLTHNIVGIVIAAALTSLLLFGMITIYVLRLKQRLDEARRQLQVMARTDLLTGVWNRGHLMDRFAEEFQRAKRQGRALGCLLLDLDHFKAVNDRFGHPAGDRVLRQLGATLTGEVRRYDIVGRYGGEEFLIIVTETPLASLVDLAERIRVAVERGIRVGEPPDALVMTVSIGAAVMGAADADIDAIIKRADDALYRAKKEGRNRVIGSWTP